MIAAVAAPGPLLGPVHQPRPHRVEVDVAAQFPEVALVLDQHGLVAALEEVAAAAVAAVELAGVAAVEILHAGGQVGPGRLDEQMIVVVHQGEGVDLPAIGLGGAADPVDAALEVGRLAEDDLPAIAARGDVVEAVLDLDAQGSCHGGQAIARPAAGQRPSRRLAAA